MGRIVPWLLVLLLLTAGAAVAEEGPAPAARAEPHAVDVHLFHATGCPHCADAIEFLNELRSVRPSLRIHLYEVGAHAENRELLVALARSYGRPVEGVPMIFLGDAAWTGFGPSVARDLEEWTLHYASHPAPDPLARVAEETATGAAVERPFPDARDATVRVPLFGEIDVGAAPLLPATLLIAMVDGVNPCSTWVLALLLGIVLGTRSRRRMLWVGGVFLTVTTLAYGAFIVGLFQVVAVLAWIEGLRWFVAALALGMAALAVKDYLRPGVGPSLHIDERHKPGLYRRMRAIVRSDRSWLATAGATAALALAATLVELPCTAGLPMVWTTLVHDAGVSGGGFAALLAAYLAVYLADELVLFAVAVIALRQVRMSEGAGRILSLVGGTVLAALAGAMAFRPELLSDPVGSLTLFAAAATVAAATLAVHALVHPASSPFGARKGRSA